MYVRQNESPFIHALSLDGPFAFCLDLPGSGYSTSEAEMHWSLAMNRQGTRLYAVNGATGVLAELDVSQQYNPQVTKTVRIPHGTSSKAGSSAAVLSADGRSLVVAGGSGIEWIDTTSLKVRMEALGDWHVSSVGLSPDGKIVYAVNDGGGIAEVSMASGDVLDRFDPGEGRPVALMRVASA
jgi:DNA-binding beta-propeller fold protein YncE